MLIVVDSSCNYLTFRGFYSSFVVLILLCLVHGELCCITVKLLRICSPQSFLPVIRLKIWLSKFFFSCKL